MTLVVVGDTKTVKEQVASFEVTRSEAEGTSGGRTDG